MVVLIRLVWLTFAAAVPAEVLVKLPAVGVIVGAAQVYVVEAGTITAPPFVGECVKPPLLQTSGEIVAFGITGLAWAVIVNVPGVPVQPLAVGVIVIVPVMAAFVELVSVNALIVGPAPLAASPIAVFELVQGKVVPATLNVDAKVTAVVLLPVHTA